MYYHVVVSSFFESDFSNPFINSFTYLTTEIAPTTAGAFELGSRLSEALFNGAGALMATTSSALRYANMVVKAPQVPSVLAVVTIDQTGDVAGDYMPRFVSYSLSSVRVRGDVRQGTKRFGGVPESLVTNGVLSGGAITNLNAVKGQLGDILVGSVSGVSTDFTPIIVKRVPYTTSSGALLIDYLKVSILSCMQLHWNGSLTNPLLRTHVRTSTECTGITRKLRTLCSNKGCLSYVTVWVVW